MTGARARGEMTSLAERMGYLQALRAAFALVALASAIFASKTVGARIEDLLLPSAAYLAVTAAGEGARRLTGRRGVAAVTVLLLLDGVFLAWVMYETGGLISPLRFLVYLHLVAVTLLASLRTGLKIALWHSLLYLGMFYAQSSGLVDPVQSPADLSSGPFTQPYVFNISALWVIALGTATFSAVNERELRRRNSELEALTDMARTLESAADLRSIASIVLTHTVTAFEFKRGALLAGEAGDLSLLAYLGPGEPSDTGGRPDEIVLRAWRGHEMVLARKFDPERNPRLSRLLPFARNLLVAPLYADGAPSGVLVLERGGGMGVRIERRVAGMVWQFATQASLALQNARLHEQVQRMSDTDPLTGVANRRDR